MVQYKILKENGIAALVGGYQSVNLEENKREKHFNLIKRYNRITNVIKSTTNMYNMVNKGNIFLAIFNQ